MKTTIKTTTIIITLLIFSPASTIADTWDRKLTSLSTTDDLIEEGLRAHKQGDFTYAFRLFKQAADQGNAVAQNEIGVFYAQGQGVQQDNEQAAFWYRKAADQGHAVAQNNLGILYEKGEGVQRDNEQAAYWYRKAADQGDANGQFNLGNLYHQNLRQICGFNLACGLKQLAISEQLYRKAAAQGLIAAKLNLGVLLSSDMFKANEGKKLLKEVASSNDPELAQKAITQLNNVQADEAAVDKTL
jgi:TPR repeat protein